MFDNFKPIKEVADSEATPMTPYSPFGAEAAAPVPVADPVVQSAPSMAGSRNVLNSDVSVKGVLRFSDALLVDGSVEGQISSDGALTVGSNATIVAGEDKVAIRTQSALIQGKVTGNVEVTDFIELAASAELVGDVRAARMIVRDGAVFIGYSAVGAASNVPVAMTAKPKSKAAAKNTAAASQDLL